MTVFDKQFGNITGMAVILVNDKPTIDFLTYDNDYMFLEGRHPSIQCDILKQKVVLHNLNSNNPFLFVTHSIYVLTMINVLLLADERWVNGNDKDKIAVESILPRCYHLSHDSLFARYIDSNVSAIDIYDAENNLIVCDQLDSISDDISDMFGMLLDIGEEL